MQSVILKPGKEKPAQNFHHWIFSGAIKSLPEFVDGDILPVESFQGELLGHAYFNRQSNIIGRFVCFGRGDPQAEIKNNLASAIELRKKLFEGKQTTAYRLINAEGDNLPGLVVDKYSDVLVVQIATLGMEKLKPEIFTWLKENLQPKEIYERKDVPSRKEEGLNESKLTPSSSPPSLKGGGEREQGGVNFLENDLKFTADIQGGQKTGFYLDQREMRLLAKEYAAGRKVLNCFAYTGAFNVYALAGGAMRADAVEISAQAEKLYAQNLEANGFSSADNRFIKEDVFDFLRSDKAKGYDFIILDPPAFAKRRDDVVQAARGYKDINRLGIKNVMPGGFVLTSSCSYFVDEKLFRQVVFQGAAEAGRKVKILSKHALAPDHPINIFHPEGEYLKSLLLYVE